MGLISEKTEVLYAELNERAEAATGSYSVIFLHRYFLTILTMVTEQLYERKILCGCFHLYGCGYLCLS